MTHITLPSYFTTYSLKLDLSLKIQGQLSTAHLTTFARGSPCGFFAEDIIAEQLSYCTTHDMQSKGYDLLSINLHKKIEIKALNKNGCDLRTSSEKGVGRVSNANFYTIALQKDFIVVDTSNIITTGNIDYIIIPGKYISTLNTTKISYTNKKVLQQEMSYPVNW